MNLIVEIIRSTLPSMVPVLLVALGGAFSYHADVFNIAMEGMLLMGAFAGVAVSFATGSWVLGLLAAVGGSLLVSLLFTFFSLNLKTDPFVTGIGINLLVAGLSTYLLRQIFNVKGSLTSTATNKIAALPRIDIPILKDIPVLGRIISGQNVMVYIAILVLVPLVYIVFYKTAFGLRLRATGVDDRAVDSIGIRSTPIKVTSLVICGVFCGLGGAALSLGYMTMFTENMSSGRGWISLAIIILTKGRPVSILLLAFLFGLLEGIGISLQTYSIPTQFTQMLPYICTIIALYMYSDRKKAAKKA